MEKTFGTLKSVFIFAPVLHLFDPFRKIIIEINAFNYTLGVILSQKGLNGKFHPVAFYSRKFTPAEMNYEIHNKELLVIIKAFKKWYHYFKGAKYKIKVFINH